MKRRILLISTIILWIVVMIPAILLLGECLSNSINGTYHGFTGEELLYGIPAFFDTLFFYFTFFIPLFILWFFIFTVAVSLTITTIVMYCRKGKN